MRSLALLAAVVFVLVPFGARAQGLSVQRISGKRIALLAGHEIAAVAHGPDQDLVPATAVPDQVVAQGHVELRAQPPIGSSTFINVPVEIDLDGRLDRTVLVGYRMQEYIETAVAARDLVPGAVLSAGDLAMARVPYVGHPANSIDVLLGRRVQNAFFKDQPITIEATAVNQIVKAGSTVVFIVRDSGVAVTADAIARTGGGLGDQVFVFNTSTHKALSGVVTGPGTVELDISGGDQQ